MFCDKLSAIIEEAVTIETQSAKAQHGAAFLNAHEALGVLEEERFELDAEVDAVFELISEDLILAIHENDEDAMIDTLRLIEQTARHAAMEAIQVAAVARKFAEGVAEMKETPSPADAGAPCHPGSGPKGEPRLAVRTKTDEAPNDEAASLSRFLSKLDELLKQDDLLLLDLSSGFSWDYIPTCYTGFEDRQHYYFFPQRLYDRINDALYKEGDPLDVSCKRICQLLRDAGFLHPDGSYPCKGKQVGKKKYRLLWIDKKLMEEDDHAAD